MDSAKRVISGTWGELWMDGEYVAECYGLQAKYTYNKEDVARCRQMAVDSKVISTKGTGSVTMHKVNSRMALKIGDKIRDGKDVRFTIVSKLDDPDAYGAERVSLLNVSYDDFTLADWQAASKGTISAPFTFTDHKYLDTIGVR